MEYCQMQEQCSFCERQPLWRYSWIPITYMPCTVVQPEKDYLLFLHEPHHTSSEFYSSKKQVEERMRVVQTQEHQQKLSTKGCLSRAPEKKKKTRCNSWAAMIASTKEFFSPQETIAPSKVFNLQREGISKNFQAECKKPREMLGGRNILQITNILL